MTILLRLLFWAALLFAVVMALWPLATPIPDVGLGDKWQHMIAFFTLSLLAALAYPRTPLRTILLRMAVLGAGIEIAQLLMVSLNRTGSWLDLAADLAATLVALALAGCVRLLVRRTTRTQEEPGRSPTA